MARVHKSRSPLEAARLHTVIDEHGAEAIWPYWGSGTMGYIQGIGGAGKRLFHALGASRHDPNICSAAAYPGLAYTSGRGSSMDPMDMARAGVVLIWGANTVSTNQHLWPFIREARNDGPRSWSSTPSPPAPPAGPTAISLSD